MAVYRVEINRDQKNDGIMAKSPNTKICCLLFLLLTGCATQGLNTSNSNYEVRHRSYVGSQEATATRFMDVSTGIAPLHFPRYGQCQIKVPLKPDLHGLWISGSVSEISNSIRACLSTAIIEEVDVLILPELALALPKENREQLVDEMKTTAVDENMIIVGGSFYDEQRYNRLVVIGPDWVELGYKMRPSRFEVSPLADKGMTAGEEIKIFKTDFGTIAVITCVDLISDEIQYLMRSLATRQEIDVLANINHNPAAWEFLIEANSIARRHPVFVSITNVNADLGKKCIKDNALNDNGYCYGHSAVFSSLRNGGPPNTSNSLLQMLPPPSIKYLEDGRPVGRKLPYSHIVGDIGSFREGMLIYELNMLMKQVPKTTNAPDQGYPPIRGIKIVDLHR